MNTRHHISLLRAVALGLCGTWAAFVYDQAHAANSPDLRPGSRIVFTDDAYMGIGAAATSGAGVAAATPGAPVTVVPRRTAIKEGERFDLALAEYAKESGWIFKWYPKRTWKAIGTIDLTQYKDAQTAIEDIISGLRLEGKPVQIRTSEGNHVMEVLSTEVTND